MDTARRSAFYIFCVLILLAIPFMVSTAAPQKAAKAPPTAKQASSKEAPSKSGDVERGRYLVEEVAKCPECHTPRDANGQPDRSRWLQGSPIWITPVHPDSNWANYAPALAGFPSFSDEQGEQILEKGIGPNGLPIRAPMHIYHMNHADAMAIIAYLRSLPGRSQ